MHKYLKKIQIPLERTDFFTLESYFFFNNLQINKESFLLLYSGNNLRNVYYLITF